MVMPEKEGGFDIQKCIPFNIDCVLPPSSRLRSLLVIYWTGYSEKKHNWWNFYELRNILIRLSMENSRKVIDGVQYEFDLNSPFHRAFKQHRMTMREMANFIESEVIPFQEISNNQLVTFYNPACPCAYCRQDFDICGNFQSTFV